MRMLDFFSFLMTNIALVKMYTPLCGGECEFSNGVVPGNSGQVSCIAPRDSKLCCGVFLGTQSLDRGNFKQWCQHFMGKMVLCRWAPELGNHYACLWCH